MADTLPTPPPESSSSSSTEADLITRLDDLLASYLEALDSYTSLRNQLSKHFRDGFFALANANRTSTLGSGRRYGEEGYDQRMKASRVVKISADEDLERDTTSGAGLVGSVAVREKIHGRTTDHFTIQSIQAAKSTNSDSPSECQVNELVDEKQHHNQVTTSAKEKPTSIERPSTSSSNPPPTAESPTAYLSPPTPTSTSTVPQTQTSPPTTRPNTTIRNPLNWYGILIPPSLRRAQSHFTSTLESPIPQLLNITTQLRHLESQITSIRKTLNIQVQAQYGNNDDPQSVPESPSPSNPNPSHENKDKHEKKDPTEREPTRISTSTKEIHVSSKEKNTNNNKSRSTTLQKSPCMVDRSAEPQPPRMRKLE